MHRSKFKFI